MSTQTQIEKLREQNDYIFALAGNPNVGKSTIFSSLTSEYVETANYPGKTVGLNIASTVIDDVKIGLVDLPGAYSLGAVTDDQWVARRALLDYNFDAVIYIMDATNLARNLYKLLQLIDMKLPVAAALNLTDEAEKRGIYIDKKMLSNMLGIPIVETVAVKSVGLEKLMKKAVEVAKTRRGTLQCAPTKHIEDTEEIIKERNERADKIAQECQIISIQYKHSRTGLFDFITHPFWGALTLIGVILTMFFVLYYAGSFLSGIIENLWKSFVSPPFDRFIMNFFDGNIAKTLVFAFDDGILAALLIGIPYIFVFYLMLAFLEDTGYLNIVAFLVDKIMHKFGLHGRASIMLIAAMGCNVPAIMGIKTLNTQREKFIASLLITFIPCSARTGVIMGAVSLFLGPLWAISIFLITLLIVFISGYFLNKILKGASRGLVMEISDMRMPSFKIIIYKTWNRFKDFIYIAFPIIVAGSLVLGYLYNSGLIWYFEAPLRPVVEGMLGLPAVAGLTLIFAVLRKELALVFLMALAAEKLGLKNNVGAPHVVPLLNFMTKGQIYVFALVNTLYIPCIATLAALMKEIGIKKTTYVTILTILTAILIGTIARVVIEHWHLL